MNETAIQVHADADMLAAGGRRPGCMVRLIDAQAERGFASVVLTGGRVADAVYRAVGDSPARDAVDWSRVDVWWGDERFLPAGHPDRNETQARAALLDALPLDPARVHPMPASDGPDGDDPEAAAARYADELAAAARPGTARLPHFDLLLLGVGEDGHVASIFPEQPAAYETRPVAAVRGSPKPPPVRITLTLPAINTAGEVWLHRGRHREGRRGRHGAGRRRARCSCPAAGVHGVERTLWLLDRAAATRGPPARQPREPTLARRLLAAAGAQPLHGLGEDRRAVRVAAALLHVGQVGLVRLDRRCGPAGSPRPGRPAGRSGAVPQRRHGALGRERMVGLVPVGAPVARHCGAAPPRYARRWRRPSAWGLSRLGCHGWRFHLPRLSRSWCPGVRLRRSTGRMRQRCL